MVGRSKRGSRCSAAEALAAFEGWASRPVDDVLAVIDPDAVIAPRAAGGWALRGRQMVRQWLESARAWPHYRIEGISLLPLADDVLVVSGRVQWMKEDARVCEAHCVWSIELRDGRVYRSSTFSSIGEARKALAERTSRPRLDSMFPIAASVHSGKRVRLVAPVEGLPMEATGTVIGLHGRSNEGSHEGTVLVQFEDAIKELPLRILVPVATAEDGVLLGDDPEHVDVEAHALLRCVECGTITRGDATGWRAIREDEAPEIVLYCPDCALREFGPSLEE